MKINSEEEIIELIEIHRYLVCNDITNSIVHTDDSIDLEKLEAPLLDIEIFTRKCIKSERDPFFLRFNKLGDFHSFTSQNKGITEQMQFLPEMASHYNSEYAYGPYLDLFFKSCERFNVLNQFRWAAEDKKMLKIRLEIFNEFVAYIRKEGNESKFKKRISALKTEGKRKFAKYSAYANALFAKYSKICVVRVDLAYKQKTDNPVSFERIQRDRDAFLNNARQKTSIFGSRIGTIWVLEYGPKKGYHLHCLFFFNGHEIQQDGYYAMQIGKYWRKVAGSDAISYLGNLNKQTFAMFGKLGIGMIREYDRSKRENLIQIVKYFCKQEQYLKFKPTTKVKRIGTQHEPTAKRQGRPRKLRDAVTRE